MVRHITAPLSRLAATADQIAHGALDLTADVSGDVEISTLAGAFNGMMARLRQARADLEQRVQQRTAELAQANARLRDENTVRRQAERDLAVAYTNPALNRLFDPFDGRPCHVYQYGRSDVCPWCPNAAVWQGHSVHREVSLSDGGAYEAFDTPVTNAEGPRSKTKPGRRWSA